jgi:hypothetical protein
VGDRHSRLWPLGRWKSDIHVEVCRRMQMTRCTNATKRAPLAKHVDEAIIRGEVRVVLEVASIAKSSE